MFYRLYTGDDGQSHLDQYEPPERMPATEIVVRRHEPGNFLDWHPAPRRQFIVTLAGRVEIGLGDGTVHTLGPGDMMLAEDLTGQGHTTRAVGPETRVSIAIPID
jgi:quercetin dioxygenase-like cupin family protein